ncbi:MAG: hypothetical protein LHW64_05030 [Candidatus Cloacimonetes bacterium]|nr:hypothetical protein [Candidatus Cloacimonadota bacterium]MDY0229467.1 hypothetical protein [Candidatus Cloacimonadaceae bacterium]
MVLKYPIVSGLFGLHMELLLLFDSFRMEFKEPFIVSKYPLASGLFGLHMEQATAPAV